MGHFRACVQPRTNHPGRGMGSYAWLSWSCGPAPTANMTDRFLQKHMVETGEEQPTEVTVGCSRLSHRCRKQQREKTTSPFREMGNGWHRTGGRALPAGLSPQPWSTPINPAVTICEQISHMSVGTCAWLLWDDAGLSLAWGEWKQTVCKADKWGRGEHRTGGSVF